MTPRTPGAAALARVASVALGAALRGALGAALGAALALAPAGCGGSQRAPDRAAEGAVDPAPAGSHSAIERRRDAACDALGPRLTACAVADARADLAAGKIDQRQFERDTAPAIQRKNTEEFETRCKAAHYSSRQVRVLEVCSREETECAPLLDCLAHLHDPDPAGARS
jgi:hypothetical protein